MFCLNDTMRYFLCPGKTDMRKGINSLCGLVHDKMGYDVRLGDVFIFVNALRKVPSDFLPMIVKAVPIPWNGVI